MPLLSKRKHRLVKAFAGAFLALWPLSATGLGNDQPAPVVIERRFADWTLRCEDETCWVYLNVAPTEEPRRPYALTIGARAQEGAYRLLVHTAKASRLIRKQGIDLYVDGQKAGHLAFVRCGEPDCIFLADYPRASIDAVVGAQSLVLWTPDSRLLQGAAMEVSTDGLKEAFGAFRASAEPGLLPR
jgi:invasion protein IalB